MGRRRGKSVPNIWIDSGEYWTIKVWRIDNYVDVKVDKDLRDLFSVRNIFIVGSPNYYYPATTHSGKSMRIHLIVFPSTSFIDHINGDKLDARRSNLREATRSQNGANRIPKKSSSSKFMGVAWYSLSGKWRTQITFEGKVRHVGYFTNEVDAAKAYDAAALKYHGEFARINTYDV